MKKFFLALAFAIAYAAFLSLGFECSLNLFGISMAISLDGSLVTKQYPRFIAFCIIVALLALVSIIAIFVLNLKVSDKFDHTKKIWWIQMIIAAVISIPMIKPWELLFEFLQKTV